MIRIAPITLKEANAYVKSYHRHHKPCAGHKFSISIIDASGVLCGVVIAGRPVSRMADDGRTIEVSRCCTNGARNGCSMLYRAACRAAKAMGYHRLITYTLASESGISLRASGFTLVGKCGGGSWSRSSRQRKNSHPLEAKHKWEITFANKLRKEMGTNNNFGQQKPSDNAPRALFVGLPPVG